MCRLTFLLQVLEFFHFACTSEDINNLAHGLMLKEALDNALFPVVDNLIVAITNMAKVNAHVPMLSRTHGQVKATLQVLNCLITLLLQTRILLSVFAQFLLGSTNVTRALSLFCDWNLCSFFIICVVTPPIVANMYSLSNV